jgi:hypothetical protein
MVPHSLRVSLRFSMPSRFFSLVALLCFSSSLHAQQAARARYQLYGGYSLLSNSFNGVPGSRQPLNGWDASIAFPPWRSLRFKIDTSGYRGTNLGAQQSAFFIMGGGQYGWHFGKEAVFVEGLAGDGGLNRYWGANQTPGETASFSTLVGGGLDTPLTRHFAFRVEGDYFWTNFALVQSVSTLIPYRIPGLPNNFGRISTGCVWRF